MTKANVNARDKEGNTPLLFAVQSACHDTGIDPGSTQRAVLFLQQYGAQINAENNRGQRALDIAIGCKRQDLAAFLKTRGARMD